MTGDTVSVPTPTPTASGGYGGKQAALYEPCECRYDRRSRARIHNPKYKGCRLNWRTEPLIIKAKAFCPRFKNQWISVHDGPRRATFPLGCNKWDCNTCGKPKDTKLRMRIYEGLHHAYQLGRIPDDYQVWLLTITWRGKQKPEYGGGFATTEARNRWAKLVDDPKQLIKDCNRDINRFIKRFERKFGFAFPWILKVIEATKQGMPHYHMVVAMPPGFSHHDWIKWSRETWREITVESDHFHTRFQNKQYTKSIKAGIAYRCKYLTKAAPLSTHSTFKACAATRSTQR